VVCLNTPTSSCESSSTLPAVSTAIRMFPPRLRVFKILAENKHNSKPQCIGLIQYVGKCEAYQIQCMHTRLDYCNTCTAHSETHFIVHAETHATLPTHACTHMQHIKRHKHTVYIPTYCMQIPYLARLDLFLFF